MCLCAIKLQSLQNKEQISRHVKHSESSIRRRESQFYIAKPFMLLYLDNTLAFVALKSCDLATWKGKMEKILLIVYCPFLKQIFTILGQPFT